MTWTTHGPLHDETHQTPQKTEKARLWACGFTDHELHAADETLILPSPPAAAAA